MLLKGKHMIDYIRRVEGNQLEPIKMKKSYTLSKGRSLIYDSKIKEFIRNCRYHPSWTIKLQEQKFK